MIKIYCMYVCMNSSRFILKYIFKNRRLELGVAAHTAFNSSIWEVEAGGSL